MEIPGRIYLSEDTSGEGVVEDGGGAPDRSRSRPATADALSVKLTDDDE